MKLRRHWQTYIVMISACLALAANVSADTVVSGALTTDTVWALAQSPYRVTGHITVNEGVTLTIEPGCELRFNSGINFTVYGKLLADGTQAQPIIFRRDSLAPWGGMTLNSSAPGTILDSCRLTNFIGINVTSADVSHSPTISNCFISTSTNGNYNGISVTNSNPVIMGNVIKAHNGITIELNNEYRLLPTLQENALAHDDPTTGGDGIYVHIAYVSNMELTIRRCHARGFSNGITFYLGSSSSTRSDNEQLHVEECILYCNQTSVNFRVYYSYSYGYTGSYTGTVEDSWLTDVSTSNVDPYTTVTCTANYWTAPEAQRSNITMIEYVNDRVANPFPEGDVNDDGVTNQDDAEMVMSYLIDNLALGDLPNAADADADGDTDIDMRDATLIRAFFEGLLWKLPR